ncbi:hypothetical protein FQR65_LT20309 [Abscondita terminalis]|nr:hypothetical protein FQR65_LT20309 [Abscondita terminalis]
MDTNRPSWRSRSWPIATGMLVVIALVGMTTSSESFASSQVLLLIVTGLTASIVVWALLSTRAQRKQYETELAEWAADRAAQAERLRIAGELHDLVSHGLGIITVRAAVALSVTAHRGEPGEQDEQDESERAQEHTQALTEIERTSRQTTTELRRMLTVLRSPDAAPLRPADTLADLQEIVELATAAGLDASLHLAELGEVSAGVQLTTCAVVREALHNTLRHSGPTAASVNIHRDGDTVIIDVTDSGPRGEWSSRPGAGHGITGLPHCPHPRSDITTMEPTMTTAAPAAPAIRVLIADDQALLRHSLSLLVNAAPDLAVIGEAATGQDAERLACELVPDVVLMDIRMPGGDGIAATRSITANSALASCRVLMLSMFELDEYVYEALHAGASGFLLKDAHPAQLLDAIRRTHTGESLFAPTILTRLVEHYVARPAHPTRPALTAPGELSTLTAREQEVLVQVARGLSNSEIASTLFISVKTVKTHIGNLLAKLHARDRAQLVILAYEHRVIAAP